jgi:arylsulfatase A-like enzyme
MGLLDETAIIFTSDHGFYFGEHGGLFGKMTFAKRPNGALYWHGDPDSTWAHSPLYEELVAVPMLVYVPGIGPGTYKGLSSAVDVMPTVLDMLGQEIPGSVEGRSLLPAMRDASVSGRDFAVTTIPFANLADRVRSVDNVSRPMLAGLVTTVTAGDWSLLYTVDPGLSELYHLPSDPGQKQNVVHQRPDIAKELHQYLVKFMRDTNVASALIDPRRELRL